MATSTPFCFRHSHLTCHVLLSKPWFHSFTALTYDYAFIRYISAFQRALLLPESQPLNSLSIRNQHDSLSDCQSFFPVHIIDGMTHFMQAERFSCIFTIKLISMVVVGCERSVTSGSNHSPVFTQVLYMSLDFIYLSLIKWKSSRIQHANPQTVLLKSLFFGQRLEIGCYFVNPPERFIFFIVIRVTCFASPNTYGTHNFGWGERTVSPFSCPQLFIINIG